MNLVYMAAAAALALYGTIRVACYSFETDWSGTAIAVCGLWVVVTVVGYAVLFGMASELED